GCGDHELPRLDGEEIGGRGDRGPADPEVPEYCWRGDIEGDRAVGPSPAAGGGVDGHVEGGHFGVRKWSGELVHRGGQDAQLGGCPEEADGAIRTVLLAGPDEDLGVW